MPTNQLLLLFSDMVEKERNILLNNFGIDFKSFLGINPFDLRKESNRLPSSGVFVTAELRPLMIWDGMIVAGSGVVTTYPYEQRGNYWFLPPSGDPTHIEIEFPNFNRGKQLEIEYVCPKDIRKQDRHKFQNELIDSDYGKSDGWVTEEKIKTPSNGRLILRRGPSVVIDSYRRFLDESSNFSFSLFRLLSYFESSDKQGLLKFVQGVYQEAVKLPTEDVDLIMVKAKQRLGVA